MHIGHLCELRKCDLPVHYSLNFFLYIDSLITLLLRYDDHDIPVGGINKLSSNLSLV